MKEFPLDIPLVCALCLPPALEKYGDYVGGVPAEVKDFVKEWNRVLFSVARRPEYFRRLGWYGKAAALARSPKLIEKITNSLVPHRSFEYAARFVQAYDLASNALSTRRPDDGSKPLVVDFGIGLSPLLPCLKQAHDNINVVGVDRSQKVMDMHKDAMLADSISNMPAFKTNTAWANAGIAYFTLELYHYIACKSQHRGNHTFLSLGTFPYIGRDEQKELLLEMSKNFKHFYIELERAAAGAPPDKEFVKKFGVEYRPGWTHDEINALNLGQTRTAHLGASVMLNKREEFAREYKKVHDDIMLNDTSVFISR